MRLALLGTGLMGSRIGLRLLRSGCTLTVWNRTREKMSPLLAEGARAGASPGDAVVDADATIGMLTDGPAVTSVLFDQGAADAFKEGSLFIDMSSISPATARENATRLHGRGVAYIDAPVSGGTRGAEQGTLAIMAGGDSAAFDGAQSILSLLGRPTHVGPAGAGQLAKLVNQVICGVTIGAVAEGLVLAASGGADPGAVREALFGGFADSRVLSEHGERMVKRDFVPGGAAQLHLKDLNTALEVARGLELELPLANTVRDLFADLVEHGCGGLDHSAILVELERRSHQSGGH
jgi:2-hydroxy-3-oxopropionate reductase